MNISETVRDLLNAGLSIDDALAATRVFESRMESEARAELRRLKDRDRKRLARALAETPEDLDEGDFAEDADIEDDTDIEDEALKERSPTPPKENIYNTPISPKPRKQPRGMRAFPVFWAAYPDKTGERAARVAFRSALNRARASTILAGLARVSAGWTDPAFVPHADKWLIRNGWRDPVPQKRVAQPTGKVGASVISLTPERRAELVRCYLDGTSWNTSWGKRPTAAEIAAAQAERRHPP